MSRTARSLLAIVLLVLATLAMGCGGSGSPSPTPPTSTVTLTQAGISGGAPATFSPVNPWPNVTITDGTTTAYIICGQTSTPLVASSPGVKNAQSLSATQCPDLLTTGAQAMIVETSVGFPFDCQHCSGHPVLNGSWTIGQGVRTWRGTITVKSDDTGDPTLVFVPLYEPPIN